MWNLKNETPFAASYANSQNYRTGGAIWRVAVKGTFDISPNGSLGIAEEQVEVLSSPRYRDEEDNSSIVYPGDLEAQAKDRVDVLLNAHAYAPQNKKAKEISVGVAIDKWVKQLKVIGDRRWDSSLGIMFQTDPTPFEKIPIIYENAFGGVDDFKEEELFFEGNPVGKGYAKSRSHRIGQKLPNIEYLDQPTKNGKPGKNRVAGFGPICAHWAPRFNYGGTYDEKWREERFPLNPLDFNRMFYQCAPEDQQIRNIFGGEKVVLLNLTPGVGYLEFKLPDVELTFHTKIKRNIIQHQASLHTILIEPDFPRLQMVWHTSVDCHNQERDVERTYIECKIHKL